MAALAVQTHAEVTGKTLDYSPASLQEVEQTLDGFARGGLTSKTNPNTVLMLGAYLGEVIVRNTGAKWVYVKDLPNGFAGAPPNYLVVQMPGGSAVNPLGKVAKRLDEGEGDSIVFFYKVITSDAINEATQQK